MPITSTMSTVEVRLDRNTAIAMIRTIRDAMIHAVGTLSDTKMKQKNMDIFRMTTAYPFSKAPEEFDTTAFRTVQRAFIDTTSMDSARMRHLRRTPEKSWAVNAFKIDLLAINPNRDTYLTDAYVASVNYLAGQNLTKKVASR